MKDKIINNINQINVLLREICKELSSDDSIDYYHILLEEDDKTTVASISTVKTYTMRVFAHKEIK